MKTILLFENDTQSIDKIINKWIDENGYKVTVFDIKIGWTISGREAVVIYED